VRDLNRLYRDEPALWEIDSRPVDDAASAALDHSDPLIRETLGSTPLDARPSEIIRLPRYSIKPFLVSVFITGAVVGVLFDIYWMAAGSALVTIPFIIAWLWPEAEDQTDEQVRVVGDLRLPLETTGYGSTPWWGVMLFILSVGMTFFSFVGSYFYLAFTAPQWPPPGAALPSLTMAAVAAVLLLACLVPVAAARVLQRRGALGRLPLLLAGGALLGLAGAAVMVAGLLTDGLRPRLHAYDAAPDPSTRMVAAHRIFPVDAALWIWGFCVVVALVALATGHLAPHIFVVAT
jgi:cytochrome c oxidase subunit I+III